MKNDYSRIEEAIQYLKGRSLSGLFAGDVSSHLGMSETQFNLMIQRWAGVTFQGFFHYLTIKFAREQLKEGRNSLKNSPGKGKSRGEIDSSLALTMEERRSGKIRGRGLKVSYGFHESPFGNYLLGIAMEGVCYLSFSENHGRERAVAALGKYWEGAELREDAGLTKEVGNRIFMALNGKNATPLNVYLQGTNFQLKVWEKLLRIPFGGICSYEDLALAVGSGRGARAVGNALGKNPVPYLVPCHRVIRKSGEFGNYGGGRARKMAMIGWEAAKREL
jgi:AraC family transcriptional regulator of adaptative response/methylated-DNA-[protein]-cysteine methyltransferase